MPRGCFGCMNNSVKIQQLLEKQKELAGKLNILNEEINDTGTDGEDMIPGHDEGAEWWAKMDKYKMLMDQVKSIKKELKELGYKYG